MGYPAGEREPAACNTERWRRVSVIPLIGVQPLQAAIKDPGFDLTQAEQGAGVGESLLVVERLAGENVDVDVVPMREGVDADVAFGDDDEAGDAAVVGTRTVVFQDLGFGDFGHAEIVRILVQEGPEPFGVPHHVGVAAEPVDYEVHWGNLASGNKSAPSPGALRHLVNLRRIEYHSRHANSKVRTTGRYQAPALR